MNTVQLLTSHSQHLNVKNL